MYSNILSKYEAIVGINEIEELYCLAKPFKDLKIVQINSTRHGGGVAELLNSFIPLINNIGIDCSWEIMEGTADFFQITKSIHNGLQGNNVVFSQEMMNNYASINKLNAIKFKDKLENADLVIIHDPQPAALLNFCDNRKGKWIWRCHIDTTAPQKEVWNFISEYVKEYNASVFSMEEYIKPLPHIQQVIPPCIDPFSPKNEMLDMLYIAKVCNSFNIDLCRDRKSVV